MARLVSTILVAVAVASCTPTPAEPDPTAPPAAEVVTVEFVTDGDTFTSNEGTTFRLNGINAPESDECFYAEAADGLSALFEGAMIQVVPTGIDQFGRTLTQAFADGEWVNEAMVAEGMALATTPEDGDRYDLVASEGQAFIDRVGLWSETACGASGLIPDVTFDPDGGDVDPPGPDENALSAETVVIVNRGEVAVQLAGWSIRDESSRHRYTFGEGATIEPGERLTISSGDRGWDPGASPVWNNGGDLALLLDPSGRVVDRYRY